MTKDDRPSVEPVRNWLYGKINLEAERVVIGAPASVLPKVEFTSLACLYPHAYVLFGASLNTAQEYRQEILNLRLRPQLGRYNLGKAVEAWPDAVARVRPFGLPVGFYGRGIYRPTTHRRHQVAVLWVVKGVPVGYFLHRMQEAIRRHSS